MKKIITVILLFLILVACGSSNQDITPENVKKIVAIDEKAKGDEIDANDNFNTTRYTSGYCLIDLYTSKEQIVGIIITIDMENENYEQQVEKAENEESPEDSCYNKFKDLIKNTDPFKKQADELIKKIDNSDEFKEYKVDKYLVNYLSPFYWAIYDKSFYEKFNDELANEFE